MLERSKSQGVAELLVDALGHRDEEMRGMAVEILGTIGLEKYVMQMAECLRDPHPTVRWKAAYALQKARSVKAVEPLVEALRDRSSDVRWCAAFALGTIGSEKAVEGLIACLDDPHIEVKYHAASSLGWIRDERAVKPLLKLLVQGSANKPRRSAAFALGNFKDKTVIGPLTQSLADADPEVRSGAAYSLGKIGSEEGACRAHLNGATFFAPKPHPRQRAAHG